MNRLYRLIILIVSVGMLLFLAACGQNSTGSNASQPGISGTPGTAQLVKTGIVPTKVPLNPSPTSTAPAQSTGKVILHIDTIPQPASASMVLTLNNQTNQEILFADHLSECTVLLLQASASNGLWQAVAPCKLMTVTRLHSLANGKNITITLIPPDGQWTPGLYRALLSYIPGGADHTPQTVFSPSFSVGA